MGIRALIVDDEAPARRRLATMLADHDGFELIGECGNGPDAVDAIVDRHPDLVFLDVQMPEMNGFEVVDAVGPEAVRSLVFVTAYDQYALKAFDARALDYLLKPFTASRFAETVERARRTLAGEAALQRQQRVGDVLHDVLPPLRERRIAARDGERVMFLRLHEVEWIEGARNYVLLHAAGRTVSLRGTLKAMAARLRAAGFLRISHSVIVNAEWIGAIERHDNGGYRLSMPSGKQLDTSSGYEDSIRDLIRLFP